MGLYKCGLISKRFKERKTLIEVHMVALGDNSNILKLHCSSVTDAEGGEGFSGFNSEVTDMY